MSFASKLSRPFVRAPVASTLGAARRRFATQPLIEDVPAGQPHVGASTEPGTEPRFWGTVLVLFLIIPNLISLRTGRAHVEEVKRNSSPATPPGQLVGKH